MTNHRLLSALKANFSAASEYNGVVFDLYISSLELVVELGRLIRVAEKFKIYLQNYPLPELTEWLSIFHLSDQLNIRYGKSGQFCPILRVARLMAQKKQLPPVDGYKELYLTLNAFANKKDLLIEYYRSFPNGTVETSTRRLRILLKYHQVYGLLPIDTNHAKSYFESLNQKSALPSIKNRNLFTLRGFYAWLILKNITTENPFDKLHFDREKIICQGCQDLRSHVRSNFCFQCYIDFVSSKKLVLIEKNFKPATAYNDYIFRLYVKYLRRYYLKYCHINHAANMAGFLTTNPITPIKTWDEIRELNKTIPNDNVLSRGGNGFIKIGRMLEEIGVLQHRELDRSVSVNRSLRRLDSSMQHKVEQFIKSLRKSRMSEATILKFLHSLDLLSSWYFAKYGSRDILCISRNILDDFIQTAKPTHQQLQSLRRFFTWATIHRLIIQNPLSHFKRRKYEHKIKILPPEKIKKMIGYIKSPESDPEHAFLLALALFWGFTARDFAFSTLDDDSETLTIQVFQPILTAKKRTRKSQVLELPSNPLWFLKLQKRFQNKWRRHYEKTIKTFPTKRLCLPYNHGHNRPLASITIVKRLYDATTAALNEKIPLKILRTTCGTLHISGTDGSYLVSLGWSKATSHKYTWCPREYFMPDPDSKSSK